MLRCSLQTNIKRWSLTSESLSVWVDASVWYQCKFKRLHIAAYSLEHCTYTQMTLVVKTKYFHFFFIKAKHFPFYFYSRCILHVCSAILQESFFYFKFAFSAFFLKFFFLFSSIYNMKPSCLIDCPFRYFFVFFWYSWYSKTQHHWLTHHIASCFERNGMLWCKYAKHILFSFFIIYYF